MSYSSSSSHYAFSCHLVSFSSCLCWNSSFPSPRSLERRHPFPDEIRRGQTCKSPHWGKTLCCTKRNRVAFLQLGTEPEGYSVERNLHAHAFLNDALGSN